MALWKETDKSPASSSSLPDTAATTGNEPSGRGAATAPATHAATASQATPAGSGSESHIAPELVVEGKIEGAGHVRIAGHFKGDVNVRGDVTIDKGAEVEGSVRAERVTIAGELTGNIESAAHVDLLDSGALTGDVKSRSFSVTKGSKMRGQVEFGWEDKSAVTGIRGTDSSVSRSDTGQ